MKHADIFTKMLEFDSIRGEDSTGMFGVTSDNKVDYLKGDADGYTFTHSQEYSELEKKIVSDYLIAIGHNRKATSGKVVPENAHPFKEGKIILVHNGVIRNAKETAGKETEVDSQAVAIALNKKDIKSAIESINGAFALVWYNMETRTLNLARNDERPLGLIEYGDSWMISSEFGLPLWLNRREGRKEISVREVPTNTILVFSLDNLSEQPKELNWDEWAAYKPAVKEPVVTQHQPWPRGNNNAHVKPSQRKPIFSVVPKTGTQFEDAINVGAKLEQGKTIMVTFDDDKETEHGGWEMIGSPVFDGVKDQNIIVRYPMTKIEFEAQENLFYKYNFFSARIRAVGGHAGVPIVYVENVQPVTLIKTFNGEVFQLNDLQNIVDRKPCPKCQKKISINDAERALIKKKSNGDFRILCGDCLTLSIQEAELSKAAEQQAKDAGLVNQLQ